VTACQQNGQMGYNLNTNGSVLNLEGTYYYATIMRPEPAQRTHVTNFRWSFRPIRTAGDKAGKKRK